MYVKYEEREREGEKEIEEGGKGREQHERSLRWVARFLKETFLTFVTQARMKNEFETVGILTFVTRDP